jgi:hypothetical protein
MPFPEAVARKDVEKVCCDMFVLVFIFSLTMVVTVGMAVVSVMSPMITCSRSPVLTSLDDYLDLWFKSVWSKLLIYAE